MDLKMIMFLVIIMMMMMMMMTTTMIPYCLGEKYVHLLSYVEPTFTDCLSVLLRKLSWPSHGGVIVVPDVGTSIQVDLSHRRNFASGVNELSL
jgi:hypothetical protein